MDACRHFPDGFEQQVTSLFVTHADAVFRSALTASHGDWMRAEDAMMDAFLEAGQTIWVAFLAWDAGKQRAWLCRRAKDRVIDSWRKTRKTTVTDVIPDLAPTIAVEDIALSRIEVDRCWKVVKGLEPRQQRAAFLRWHEGRSITEVAGMLGVDRSTASRDLAAVAALLRRELGEEE